MRDEIKVMLEWLNGKNHYIEDLLNYITNLQKENERLKEKIEHLLIDLNGESEYKIRNDKAIEYIEKQEEKQYGYNFEYNLNDNEIECLLKILKGENE